MKYGYCRVSSNGQDLQGQIRSLQEEGCEVIYSEKFTGTKMDRPEFQRLLSIIEEGDTLVVTKLDRFARSTGEAINTIKGLFEKNVRLYVLNLGVVENTGTGRLLFNVLSAFAEFERDMIVERTQEGKAIARLREDFREGRPKTYTRKQIAHALELLKTRSYREVTEMTGISKSTLLRAKKQTPSNE